MRPRFQSWWRAGRLCCSLLLTLVLAAGGWAAATRTGEVQFADVVAGYLGGFARNVTWPAEALPSNQPVRVGILAEDATYATIARGLGGESEGRRLEPVRLRGPEEVATCHALYLHDPKPDVAARIMAAAGGKPVLTILYSEDRTVRGGIIELFTVKATVKYLLNARELRRSGLRSSPELVQFSLLSPPR